MIIEKKKGGVGRGNKKQAELLHTVTGGGVCVSVSVCVHVCRASSQSHSPLLQTSPRPGQRRSGCLWHPRGLRLCAALTAKLLPNAGMI